MHLSPREIQTMLLVEQGLLNKQIAFQMGLSVSTVKANVYNSMRTLNQHTRGAAAFEARKRGFLEKAA